MPAEKPGVVAFRSMIMAAHPNTGYGGISRACNVGGTSEHKEGRAWDWMVNVSNPSQRRSAEAVLKWLAADDSYGNEDAMARRLGIMYAIWNRKIWFPGSGWRTYCVERRGACREPGSRDVRAPHTDHVHFSFTWDGALKKTSFWHASRTYISDVAGHPAGYGLWGVGGNGGVVGRGGVGFFGAKNDRLLKRPVAAMTSTPTGNGYWMVTDSGKVFAFGDARRRGSVDSTARIVDIEASASGRGYWLLTAGGRVHAMGNVGHLGGALDLPTAAVDIEATPTGMGYWIVGRNGDVRAFGDALKLGDAEKVDNIVGMAATPTGLGYWLVTGSGRVMAFGDARHAGGLGKSPRTPVVGIVPSAAGSGYWLMGATGRIYRFGDAPAL